MNENARCEGTYRVVNAVVRPPGIVVIPVNVVGDARTIVTVVGLIVGETITVIVPWSPLEFSVVVWVGFAAMLTTVTIPGGTEKAG